jgi:hypothetical protein
MDARYESMSRMIGTISSPSRTGSTGVARALVHGTTASR